MRTSPGEAFDSPSIHWVRFSHKLKSLRQRLLEAGWLTGKQIASKLGVTRTTLGRGAGELLAILSPQLKWTV